VKAASAASVKAASVRRRVGEGCVGCVGEGCVGEGCVGCVGEGCVGETLEARQHLSMLPGFFVEMGSWYKVLKRIILEPVACP